MFKHKAAATKLLAKNLKDVIPAVAKLMSDLEMATAQLKKLKKGK